MSEDKYIGMYCPIRQSDIQALKCLEEYCMFWYKETPKRKGTCLIRQTMVIKVAKWEASE